MNPTGTSQIQHHLSGTSPQINGPITQEKLRTLFATVQSMRARGATEASDPEYAQIMNFLRIYSKQQGIQQMMQHQQQNNSLAQQTATQYQQPQNFTPQQYQTMQYPNSQVQGDPTLPVQQQLPQLPQMQHSPVQLNRHPQSRDSVNSVTQSGLHSSPLQQQLPTPSQTQPESQINSRSQPTTQRISQGTPPNQSPVFSQEQLTALKYQIYAYKLLSKNLPLPEHLQRTLFSHLPTEEESAPIIATNEPESTQRPSPILSTEGSLSSPALIRKSAPDQKSIKLKSTGHFVSPYSYIREPITSYAHASRQQKVIIPTITPNGVDPCQIIEHHQNQIQSRIKSRIEELEKMTVNLFSESYNLANDGLSDEAFKTPDLPCKVDALIELKGLKMLERQKKLREEIYKGAGKSTTLVAVTDPNAFRRVKRLSLREARMTENLERQQRADRERQERQKHLDRLQNIIIHGRDMIQWHRTLQIKQSRLGKSVVQYHAHVEKEEQKRIERISKERLNALKADDEEAYLKLIDQTKDTRITHLLKQTDSYLDDLTRAVRVQQNDSLHYDPSTKGGDELMDHVDDGDSDEDMERRIDYYAIAHRFGEDVSQPDILVGGRLKEYQLKGLQWMVSLYNNRLNGILADEMGLGKTIQTISLITYLIERKNQNGPFLIILPLSTLTNWILEFEKWAPAVAKIVYKGPPNDRRVLQAQIKNGGFQVLLTTFEYIIKDKHILGKVKWVHMIIDEGHRMKNVGSKLTFTLTQFYNTRYRLILTGTPLQNNLPELWALLNFVLPKIFNSVKSFDEWFNTPFANTGGQDKIELNEEEALLVIKRLHKVLRPFLLRRLKKDVETELPDKVERVIKCKFSALQSKLYNQMRKHGVLFTNGDKGTTGIKGLNNTIMQLKKICNHPFVFEEVERIVNPSKTTNDNLYRVSGKFELLDRVLPKFANTGHRMLIFFQMTSIMTIMEDLLIYRGINYLRLDGTVKSDERTELLKKFNAPNSPYQVFLLSTRAGGLGLNLQTADTVIIFDSDWNPHQDLQAQDRAHRIGQTKEVRILRLITENSVEETILARAQYKLDIDGKVIQAGKFDNKSTAEEREAFLRNLLETDHSHEGDMDEDLNDDDLNEIIARSDQEIAIFKQMDIDRDREAEYTWRSGGCRGKKPERLMQEHELPEIYLRDHMEDIRKQRDSEIRGRGHRSKGDVRYDDGLTEEQWLDAIENDDVDLAELVTEKRKRRQSKDDDGEDTDGSEAKPRRRGRTKRSDQYDDDASSNDPIRRSRQKTKTFDDDSTRKKRKTKDPYGPDPLAPQVREAMTHLFQQLYDTVENCIDPEEDDRQRCLLFLELPSKKIYPQYYIMIQQPIAMNIIKKRMRTSFYKTILQFREDFHLMFNNARYFNEEGSWVYVDANKMQEAFDSKFQELCPNGTLPGGHGNNGTDTPDGDKDLQHATSKPLHVNYSGSEHTSLANNYDTNLLRPTYQGPPNPLKALEDISPHYSVSQVASVPINPVGIPQSAHPENVPPYTNSYTNSAANFDVCTMPNVDKSTTSYRNNPTASSSGNMPPLWRMMDDDNYDEA